jgi:hypothetical protein
VAGGAGAEIPASTSSEPGGKEVSAAKGLTRARFGAGDGAEERPAVWGDGPRRRRSRGVLLR